MLLTMESQGRLPHVGMVGVWPPPWGGISVHIKRLHDRLVAHGYRVSIFDTAGHTRPLPEMANLRKLVPDRWLSVRLAEAALESGVEVLHLHVFGAEWKLLLPLSVVQEVTGIPLVVTMHSMRIPASSLPPIDRSMFALAAGRVEHFFCAGEHVRQNLLAFGTPPERVQTIVPFLPPSPEELQSGPLDAELEAFMQAHQPLITSGTGVLVPVSGRDLYGLDLFVRAANIVRRRFPQVGFVFVLAGYCDPELLADAENFIRDHDLQNTVLLWRKPVYPATTLWSRSDVFVRPSLTDGDAISLREAMVCHVPSLASDAVGRPDGCRLFRCGDVLDFSLQLSDMLERPEAAKSDLAAFPAVDGFADIEKGLFSTALASQHKRRLAAQRPWQQLVASAAHWANQRVR